MATLRTRALTRFIVAFVCSHGLLVDARAQDEQTIMEALPQHLAWRVSQQTSNLRPAGLPLADAVIQRVKAWPPGAMPLKVCFFGGDPDLKRRIAEAATHWSSRGARVVWDFGSESAPRTCSPRDQNQVRIGFSYSGYWSLVGQDSINLANQNEQSMNFALFDISPPLEPEFTRIVQHEFGHALALEHEHQNPLSKCLDEFNWPYVYAYLAKAPNYWSTDTVKANMGRILEKQIGSSKFDNRSIMLYTFKPEFYKNGARSPCYATTNFTISEGDFAYLRTLYPMNTAQHKEDIVANKLALAEAYKKLAISAGSREVALQNLELLTSATLDPQMRALKSQQVLSPRGLD